ncbi:hypothetical protein [Sphingobium chungangianum]
MANMQYCRWENTSKDMQDCVNAMEDDVEVFDDLNRYEREGMIDCLRNAYLMLEGATPELLHKAGVDLSNLA